MKVIITRSESESQEFKKLLESKNISSFNFPCIDYAEPSDGYKELDDCIRKNHEFDWLVFLSKKAVDVFFTRLIDLGGQLYHLSPHLKIACVGEKTAEYLRDEIGFPIDFVPTEFNSDALIKEFHDNFFPEQKLPGLEKQKILIAREEGINDNLKAEFEKYAQVEVTIAKAYKLVNPQPKQSLITELQNILEHEDRVYISFASSNTVINFQTNIESIPINNFKNLKIISIGPKTSETISKLFPQIPLIQAKKSSFESMLESVLDELQKA